MSEEARGEINRVKIQPSDPIAELAGIKVDAGPAKMPDSLLFHTETSAHRSRNPKIV